MQQHSILEGQKFQITIKRLCHQLIENHDDFSESVLIGIQPRGVLLARRIATELNQINPTASILNGDLDITFFRDDLRKKTNIHLPNTTKIDFLTEDKKVILVDDVLWTGRTIRAALDAILAFGRPKVIELLTLVDRRYCRDVPIRPDYVGIQVDTVHSQKIIVHWQETDQQDQVLLLSDVS